MTDQIKMYRIFNENLSINEAGVLLSFCLHMDRNTNIVSDENGPLDITELNQVVHTTEYILKSALFTLVKLNKVCIINSAEYRKNIVQVNPDVAEYATEEDLNDV